MTHTDQELVIRPAKAEDMQALWEQAYKEELPEWDAPYYEHQAISYEQLLKEKAVRLIDQEDYWVIETNGQVIGVVSYYWEHEPSRWLEMGIVICNSRYWSGGIGSRVLKELDVDIDLGDVTLERS